MLRFRYKLSEMLLIVGIGLGIIIACHTLSMIAVLLKSDKDDFYSYSQNYALYNVSIDDISNEDGMLSYFVPDEREKVSGEKLFKCLSTLKGHKEIYLPMPIGGSLSLRRVTGVFELSEHPERLASGTWKVDPTGEYDGYVWVGKSWEPYFVNKNGASFISIDTFMYKVQGILDNTLTGGVDDTVIVYLPSCSQSSLQSIEDFLDYSSISLGDVGLLLSSDSAEDIMDVEKLGILLKDSGLTARTDNSLVYLSKVDARRTYVPLILISIVLFAFCFFNLYVISAFHFEARRAEMCIRKVFGFGEYALLKILFRELIRDLFAAIILVIPIEIVLAILGSRLAIKMTDGYTFIFIAVISFLLLFAFLIIRFLALFHRVKSEDLLAR